jgi:Ribbon-helix-helix domain
LIDGAACSTITIMKRITTTVDSSTYGMLEDLAHRDGVPTARLVREAMERYVTQRQLEHEPQPLPDWVGMFQGDGEPFAGRAEEILGEIADETYRTEVLGEPKRAHGQ